MFYYVTCGRKRRHVCFAVFFNLSRSEVGGDSQVTLEAWNSLNESISLKVQADFIDDQIITPSSEALSDSSIGNSKYSMFNI